MSPLHAPHGDHLLSWTRAEPPLQLLLTPERAVVWPAERTVFIADVHLGKAAVFRARGIPVPRGTTRTMLARLSQLIARTQAQRLVILGDFLHARESHSHGTLQALGDWRAEHAHLHCIVVQGNHDRHAGQVEASLGFMPQAQPFEAPGLIGVHEASEAGVPLAKAQPHVPLVLAGHIHPVVNLRGRLDQLRLPCYRLRGNMLTLPAFGEFTGGHAAHEPGDRLFVIAEQVHAL